MAKGIRVNQLAKELGVESKAILTKLHDEGIPNVPNHMSLIPLGLAETVREWVRDGLIKSSAGGGGGDTAVAEAPPKAGKATRKKKSADTAETAPVATEAAADSAGSHDAIAHDATHDGGGHDASAHDGVTYDGAAYEGASADAPADPAFDAAADQTALAAQDAGPHTGTPSDASAPHTGTPTDSSTDAPQGPVETGVTMDPGPQGGTATTSTPSPSGPGHTGVTGGPVGLPTAAPATPTRPPSGGPGPATPPGPAKVVPAVPFQPKPATVQGPRVTQGAAQPDRIEIPRPRFGQKIPAPNTNRPPAAPPQAAPPRGITPQAPTAPAGTAAAPSANAPGSAQPPAAPTAAGQPGGGTAGQPGPGQPGAGPARPGLPPRPGVSQRLAPDGSVLRQEQRPTVSLNNPSSLNRPPQPRQPVVVAPQLKTLEPAKVVGPRVVRIEKPEVLPPPRPRGPMRPDSGPSTTQARTDVGRGVKPTTGPEEEESEAKKAAAKGRGSLSARRRGLDGRRGEAEERLKEFTEADKIARQDMLNAAAATRAGMESHLRKTGARGTTPIARTAVQRGGEVEVEEPITIKSLSAAMGVKSNELQIKLLRRKIMVTVNQSIPVETAMELAMEYGLELKVKVEESSEERLVREYDEALAQSEDLVPRPPVVTILGHVDHGKTSLLDKIRSANVAAGEAGGITQHIAAWTVNVGGEGGTTTKRVTFIDTPGHQAFTSMRARGANMTDVVVLVVSAAEGVQPQTIESINHAKAAGVPIIVALNKIDRPDANPDMVLGQLAQQDLNPVEWGGTTEVVRTSALTGKGIPDLLELLDYQTQLLELKADPTLPARGTVIEARRDEGLGPVATVLVQEGTLSVGDYVLCGPGYGRVRSLLDDKGKMIPEAGPSTPVLVSGLSDLPTSGDILIGVADLEEARAIAEDRSMRSRQRTLAALQQRTTGANLLATLKAGEAQTINLIIKADTQGSIETLVKTVTDSNTEEVKVRVIHSGVGAITESDVELAMATKTKPQDNRVAIIGFHVVPDESARALAEHNHVDVKTYRVIYEIFDDLKKALSGMLAPEEREKYHGRAEIRQVFKVSRVGNIAGCMVIDGHIQRGSKIRLIRNGAIVVEDLSLESLKRVKDDVKEVKQGFECGMKLAGYDDIKVTDVLEAYIKETFERTL